MDHPGPVRPTDEVLISDQYQRGGGDGGQLFSYVERGALAPGGCRVHAQGLAPGGEIVLAAPVVVKIGRSDRAQHRRRAFVVEPVGSAGQPGDVAGHLRVLGDVVTGELLQVGNRGPPEVVAGHRRGVVQDQRGHAVRVIKSVALSHEPTVGMAEQDDFRQRQMLDHRVQKVCVRGQVVAAGIGQSAGRTRTDGLQVHHRHASLQLGNAQVFPADARSPRVDKAYGAGAGDVIALVYDRSSLPDGDDVSGGRERRVRVNGWTRKGRRPLCGVHISQMLRHPGTQCNTLCPASHTVLPGFHTVRLHGEGSAQ
ncbi:hypothetical protein SCANM124S_00122 [Streptomyces canus]